MTMQLGVGISGYGFIGRVHAFAHRNLPMMYDPLPAATRLVGVCTATEASGARAIRQAGFQFATTDFNALLEHPDIDVIHICTPNAQHYPQILGALRAGKHIYCDKPLALNVPQAKEIVELAKKSHGKHGMTFNYRYVPATMKAKELIDSGFLGEVLQFRGAYLHAGYVDPSRPISWRMRKEISGGGAIMDLGVHIFDLMRHLLGEFTSLNAMLTTKIEERPDGKGGTAKVDVDDLALVHARLASGAVGTLEASRLSTGKQDELRFEIHGVRGAISFNLMDPNWLEIYDANLPSGPLGGSRGPQKLECVARYPHPYSFGATGSSVGWPQFHIQCLYDFIENVASGRTSSPSFEDGLAAQRFVEACQISSSTGTSVNIESL